MPDIDVQINIELHINRPPAEFFKL